MDPIPHKDLPHKHVIKPDTLKCGVCGKTSHEIVQEEKARRRQVAEAREGYDHEWFGRRAAVLVLHHELKTLTWGFFPNKWDLLDDVSAWKLSDAISRIAQYYRSKGYAVQSPSGVT